MRHQRQVRRLVRQSWSALASAAKETSKQGRPRYFCAEEYGIEVLLIGWETWGGFDTDVEIRNLSLAGTP